MLLQCLAAALGIAVAALIYWIGFQTRQGIERGENAGPTPAMVTVHLFSYAIGSFR